MIHIVKEKYREGMSDIYNHKILIIINAVYRLKSRYAKTRRLAVLL